MKSNNYVTITSPGVLKYSPDSVTYTISSTSSFDIKKSEFGGAFLKPFVDSCIPRVKTVRIEKVIYNDPATIVFWDDGTKTVSKCSEEDSYNPETGLAICCLKKLATPTQVKDLFDDWLPTFGGNIVTMKDVRRKHKLVESSK